MVPASRVILIVWSCLAAVVGPLWGSSVFCTTESGHQAIEPAHPFSDCAPVSDCTPVSDRTPSDREHSTPEREQGCTDQLISAADMICQGRAHDSGVRDFVALPWTQQLFAARGLVQPGFSCLIAFDDSPTWASSALDRLDAVALLI